MRLGNPIDYLSGARLTTNPVGDSLPPQVVKAFAALGDAQRGLPEEAMLRAQHTMGGGALSWAIEHTGDITHRMTHMLAWTLPRDGYEIVYDKVEKVLRDLRNSCFARKHRENMESNARYCKTPLRIYMAEVNVALQAYADAHSALTVYNRAQWLARSAAVQLGMQNFSAAERSLSGLERMLETEKSWWEAATSYSLDRQGRPMLYDPLYNRTLQQS